MSAEAKINEECIIGIPTCGYAFSSSRMAFIAAPADEEFQLELDILTSLLEEKEYEAFLALRQIDPGKLAFCTKICSKIITSQFCIILLNSSSHRDHRDVQIPNPNVHMEYGLMLAFKKYVLPFQRKDDSLAFNIQPLDTLIYTKKDFRQMADRAIDQAILSVGTTSRPTRALASSQLMLQYLTVRGLNISPLNTEETKNLHRLGNFLGFYLMDGAEFVYFGMFDLESAKEVVFRVKLLLQNLDQAIDTFEKFQAHTMTPEQLARVEALKSRISIEVLISDEIDRNAVDSRISDLTSGFRQIPWKLLTSDDLQECVDKEYLQIGEL